MKLKYYIILYIYTKILKHILIYMKIFGIFEIIDYEFKIKITKQNNKWILFLSYRLYNCKNKKIILYHLLYLIIILIKMHIKDKASSIFPKVIIAIATWNFIKNKLEKKKVEQKVSSMYDNYIHLINQIDLNDLVCDLIINLLIYQKINCNNGIILHQELLFISEKNVRNFKNTFM